MTKWLVGALGGIVASVSAGLIVWWLTAGGGPITPPATPAPPPAPTATATPALQCAMTLLFDAERTCALDIEGPGALTVSLEPNLRVPWSIAITGITQVTDGCEILGDSTPTGPTSFQVTGDLDLRCQVPARISARQHDIRFLVRSPQASNFDVQANASFRR